MTVVFSTEAVPPSLRGDYLREALADSVVPTNLRFDMGCGSDSRAVFGRLGPVEIVDVGVGAGEAVRSPTLIRKSDTELYQLSVQVEGRAEVDQLGRSVSLGPGSLMLRDLSYPFHCFHTASRLVSVNFPRGLLSLDTADLKQLMAEPISGTSGTAALVSVFLRNLPDHLDDIDSDMGARLGTTVLDLLTVMLASRVERLERVPDQVRQHVLLVRIRSFIDTHLHDRALSPATVAAAHHISVRQLYKLFETQESPVADLIRRRRLERCRRDLLDPRLQSQPVAAIASRWGLSNAAYFSRTFRGTYGLSPLQYRKLGNISAAPH